MLSRVVASARSVRFQSTGSQPQPNFMADLMKRIDSINERSKVAHQQRLQLADKQKQKQTQKENKPVKTAAKSKPKAVPVVAKRQERVVVKDHPLLRNAFKLMDELNFQKPHDGKRSMQPRTNTRNGSGSGFGARNSSGPRFAARNSPRTAARLRLPKKDAARPETTPVQLKQVVATNLKPEIRGDDFFYGKVATFNATPSLRVASVAKDCLLESRYPYLLPKAVIATAQADAPQNRFILQKTWSETVEPEFLADRVRKVVKGQPDIIKLGKKADQFSAGLLQRNGDLSLLQKQTIYDVVSGVKSLQSLTETAAWKQ